MKHSKVAFFVASCILLLTTLRPGDSYAHGTPERSDHAVNRLHFRTGQHHIVVFGTLGNDGGTTPDYVFTAKAGQKLEIGLKALRLPGQKAGDMIAVMYHITFPSGKQYGMKGYDPFDGRLTETGRYHITISINQMATNAERGRYRLDLTRS